ncbi:MAG: hypothetical protein JXR05_11380 [Flavobacteriaceae bacterium]
MKKRKLKNYLRIGVFLFGISILLWSCEKEDSLELQSIENGNPFIKRAKLSTLKDLSSFVARLQDGDSNISRNSLEGTNHFTILEDRDVFIYTDSISTTYTLAIRKENQEPSSFSNLIVKFEENATTKASILNYVPTQQYLTAYNLDERAPFEGTVSYESLEYDGSLDHLNSRVIETCYTYTITYCDAPATYGGELVTHVATEGCNPDHMWTERYTVCPEPTEISPPDPDDLNDGGGGDSGDGTTALIPPCESTGSGTGISGADSDCIIVDPCEDVQNLAIDIDFSAKIDELEGNLGLTHETGYAQDINTGFNEMVLSGVNGNQVETPKSNTIMGAIHTHPDSLLVRNPDTGIMEIKYAVKMFSPGDLKSFLEIVKNGNGINFDTSEVYSALVTSDGNYMLRFSGSHTEIPSTPTLDTMATAMFYDLYVINGNDKTYGFLKFLKDALGITNVEIYEFDSNTGEIKGKFMDENGEVQSVEC